MHETGGVIFLRTLDSVPLCLPLGRYSINSSGMRAKLFMSGRSHTVRLPKKSSFEASRPRIEELGDTVVYSSGEAEIERNELINRTKWTRY